MAEEAKLFEAIKRRTVNREKGSQQCCPRVNRLICLYSSTILRGVLVNSAASVRPNQGWGVKKARRDVPQYMCMTGENKRVRNSVGNIALSSLEIECNIVWKQQPRDMSYNTERGH